MAINNAKTSSDFFKFSQVLIREENHSKINYFDIPAEFKDFFSITQNQSSLDAECIRGKFSEEFLKNLSSENIPAFHQRIWKVWSENHYEMTNDPEFGKHFLENHPSSLIVSSAIDEYQRSELIHSLRKSITLNQLDNAHFIFTNMSENDRLLMENIYQKMCLRTGNAELSSLAGKQLFQACFENKDVSLLLLKSLKKICKKSSLCNFPQMPSIYRIRRILQDMSAKESLIEIPIKHAFSQCVDLPPHSYIAVTGEVVCDGIGDLSHIYATANKLKDLFPSVKIQIIVLAAHVHTGKLSLQTQFPYELVYITKDDNHSGWCSNNHFSKETIEKIKNATLVIDVSYPIQDGEITKLKETMPQKFIQLREFDFGEYSKSITDQGVWKKRMGIGLFSEGIFSQKPSKQSNQSLLQLECGGLKKALFGTTEPSQSDLIKHCSSYKLHSCYSHHPTTLFRFMYTLAALYENTNQSIDICKFGGKNWESSPHWQDKGSVNLFETTIDFEYLKKKGYGTIRFIGFPSLQEDTEENVKILSNSSKEIRIYFLPYVSRKDKDLLVNLSEPLAGSTGDNSFAELLFLGKLPFQEIPVHKEKSWEPYYNLARELFGKEAYITRYAKWVDTHLVSSYYQFPSHQSLEFEKLADILKKNELLEQCKVTNQFICKELSLERNLIGTVIWRMFREQHQDFKIIENELREKYLYKEITLPEIEKRVKKAISDKKYLLC